MSRRVRRTGAAVVEATLVALAFIVTLIGAIDVAQFLFFHQVLRERVRAGVRYAVTHSYEPAVLRNYILWNSSAAQDRPGLFGLTAAMIAINRYDEGAEADRIEVRIDNYPVRLFTPWLAGRTFSPVFRAVEPVESLGAPD